MICPNYFPIGQGNRIAIIGESPGNDEVQLQRPFVGMSGRFLAALLSRAGASLDECYLGNVSQHQPPENDISKFKWDGPEIQEGLCQLKNDLQKYQPNIVVLVGNTALKAARNPTTVHPLKPARFQDKVGNWRGSLFVSTADGSAMNGMKCISTLHPASVLRNYEDAPLLQLDLKKAVADSFSSTLVIPQRSLITSLSCEELLGRLKAIRDSKSPVALDIEGGIGTMSCISFATSPSEAFIVPLVLKSGKRYWPASEECLIWKALAQTLEDPNVPKILQNCLYDTFVLQFSYNIRVRGIVHDTMLAHWELYCELPKALGVQTSIYTREPYYKSERKSNNDQEFYEYCCKDSAVTLEISQVLDGQIEGASREHYKLNLQLLEPLRYMELRGIRYDIEGAASRRKALQQKLYEEQARLNRLAGCGLSWTSFHEAEEAAKAAMLTKKGDRLYSQEVENWNRYREVVNQQNPSLSSIGEVETLCQKSLNVKSQDFKTYLYETLALPPQYKEDKEGNKRITTDYEALLKLSKILDKDPRQNIILAAITIQSLNTRQTMLSIGTDDDGRIRCGYNIVGSETGRISCYESPTGSGYNLQTIPNYTSTVEAPGQVLGDRDLFLADLDHWFFQCDLEGADGWTVAAYCKMLGDPTMMDDYLAGLKPAKVLAVKMAGYPCDFTDRDSIREAAKAVKKDSWEYFACKRVHHGADYLEGEITISRNILKDSEGKLVLAPRECALLKQFFMRRYWGVPRWHNWTAAQLSPRFINGKKTCEPVLTAASGQRRVFFGRPDKILTQAVAYEPQANTSYVTNLAMRNLWCDHNNRVHIAGPCMEMPEVLDAIQEPKDSQGIQRPRLSGDLYRNIQDDAVSKLRLGTKLRIEPLHQIHDALAGQFKKSDTAWAIARIKSYFANPITIAGQTITIPFDGAYGPSWGNLSEGKI
jgi:uracil-DNA glycosylase family 4